MKNLFLISSAINAKHGIYTPRERFAQTAATCKSIQTYCPGAEMIILDGGVREISQIHLEQFHNELGVKDVISYAKDENVKRIQQIHNHDVVKNVIEVLMYKTYFESVEQFNCDRVFKISGRYRLNSKFNLDIHKSAIEKIVIRGPFKSQFPSDITGGVEAQYMSRLWSFDSIMLPYIRDAYSKILELMLERQKTGYIDIEHCLYAVLDTNIIVEADPIGVEGNIAPNGVGVSD
jgi:hypothetical protein